MSKSKFFESLRKWKKSLGEDVNEFTLSGQINEINEELLNAQEYEKDIFEIIGSMALSNIFVEFYDTFGSIDSPIEKLLLGAIVIVAIEHYGIETTINPFNNKWNFGHAMSPDFLTIEPQKKIGEFKVDFYIELEDGFLSWETKTEIKSHIVVECDGHEFHEKTKEQARRDKQRDRTLLSCGYPVFRFTGSEIWNDPFKCADSIIEFLQTKSKEIANKI